MTFDWVEYLNLAETLQRERTTLGNVEACQRSAISRAYYAAYMTAANKAKAEGLITSGREQHKKVRLHYTNAPDMQRKRIGTWLQRLKDNREKSDYENTVSEVGKLTELSLDEANKVVNILNKI